MVHRVRDLADELFQQLQRRSPEHALRWRLLFINKHTGWVGGSKLTHEQQIHEINEFWRVELGLLNTNTLNARSCIIEDISPDIWLRNFNRYVMDVILTDTLPNIPCLSHTG
jgi:hypothetical protein